MVLDEIHLGSVEDAVGTAAYGDGYRELQDGMVRRLDWVPATQELHGIVQDRGGEFHETAVCLLGGKPMRFGDTYCSCERGGRCKHAAALVLAGALASGQDLRARPPSVPWERSLGSLLESASVSERAGSSTATVAVELVLSGESQAADVHGYRHVRGNGDVRGYRDVPAYRDMSAYRDQGGPPRLTAKARLVRRSAGGGWKGGQLNWDRLGTWEHVNDIAAPQLRVLRELYWTYQAGGRGADHGAADHWSAYRLRGYSTGERQIDLAGYESRQLWPLLDEATSAGIPLTYRKLGVIPRYGLAELFLDLTRSEKTGPIRINPVLAVDGVDGEIWPVRFIGSEGHGLVYVERTEAERTPDPARWLFRLARLVTPVPASLQEVALSRRPLTIPAAEEGLFRQHYYPRLRRAASLISSDGSVSLPAISPPTLVLSAAYGDQHELAVRWEWAYQIGDSQQRAPAAPAASGPAVSGRAVSGPAAGHEEIDSGYRDPEAEQAILAELDLPPGTLGPGLLSGMDTMRFSTEVLPLLAGRAGVQVEISGEPADYREAGDSLRIELQADQLPDDNDWFGLGVMVYIENQLVPFQELFLALSRGQDVLLLANGAYFSLHKPGLQALARLIEEARALQDAPAGPLRISRYQAGLWAELAELGVVSQQSQAWQRQVDGLMSLCRSAPSRPDGAAAAGATADGAASDGARADGAASDGAASDGAASDGAASDGAASDGVPGLATVPLPAGLTALLRPYQVDGFRWLAFLWQYRLGGILADDMGLGKTLQCLALICHAREEASEEDAGSAPFLVVAPTSVASNWAAEASRFAPDLRVVVITGTAARRRTELADVIAGADVVVTTYTLLRLDFAAYSALPWSGLILDEAQSTKNHQSKIYQCARRLPAPFKLAITGTPMENNLMELWSLLSITAPGLFPNPHKFQDYYAKPIEKQGKGELLDQLRRRIKPLLKRRTKEQVAADLPPKQEQVLEVELHPRHQKLYQTHLQRERQKVLGLLDDVDANRFTILRSLTLLRQLSLHAGLIDPANDDMPCGKLDALLDLLGDVVAGGHRALVFSQFTRFLERARQRLEEAGIRYCYLDGRTRDRPLVLQRFRSGSDPVFLISLKAGGFGLNLTEADYCFLLDPWWNPATEAQAVDRTHRIGQTRKVVVYRLISKDTIEDKVMALKARKAALFSSVIDSGSAFGSGLAADDIRGLFE